MQLVDAIKLVNYKDLSQQYAKWADLGCGTGLFTYALANVLKYPGVIYAIDKHNQRLKKSLNPHDIQIFRQQLDFEKDSLDLPLLDGILMANSLHYIDDKSALLQNLAKILKPEGHLLVVEYDTDTPNHWVPFPVSFNTLKRQFQNLGFRFIIKIHELPSIYRTGNIYSALISNSFKRSDPQKSVF